MKKDLGPTVNEPPRRSYLPKRNRQTKLIPTDEALKLLSETEVRSHRRVVRKKLNLKKNGTGNQHQDNAGVGVNKTKGKGKGVVNKRKVVYEEGESSGKQAKGYNKP